MFIPIAHVVLSAHKEHLKLLWPGPWHFFVPKCSLGKAEKEFSFSPRLSYFLFFFFSLCTLSSWLSLALLPLSLSIFSLFSSFS